LMILPSKPEDIKNLKKSIVAEVDELSPEALKLFSDLVKGIKSIKQI